MIRLLMLVWLAARAQDTATEPAPSPTPSPDAEAPASPAPEPEPVDTGPMTLGVARTNFATVVESYILQNQLDEAMPLKDKTGKRWRLRLERIESEKVRELAPNRFVGCAFMRDGRHRLDVDFTVDLSGPRWRVKAVNIHKVDGKPRFKYKGAERVPL
ncbi:MAG: hypothetical protein HY553_22045 [Elusimicrobia bacterium]|nr:hypothetical protein [Elusimicrobiota bacterium]